MGKRFYLTLMLRYPGFNLYEYLSLLFSAATQALPSQ